VFKRLNERIVTTHDGMIEVLSQRGDHMKTFFRLVDCLFALMVLSIGSPADAQQPPWFDAPVVNGSAGNFTCVTTPNPRYGAVITCDPSKMAGIPPAARAFLINHEHGHVAQMRLGRTLFVPNPEADADCYAAKIMRSNPDELNAAIAWLRNVLGPRGGDILHGTGFQVADFATQCANNRP
jgi:hypothetical protein